MGIGAGIFLVAVGAILAWAVNINTASAGVNLHTIGYILLAVGIVGILLSMVFWSSWGSAGFRRRTTTVGPGGPPTSTTTVEQ